jgi:hypothetical protein
MILEIDMTTQDIKLTPRASSPARDQ